MKILLDESVPRLLKLRLSHLDISTVQEMGWAGVRNGELLRRAEEHFNIFITADQNLQYQQNLSGRRLAILVLPSNQVPIVTQLLPSVETLLAMIQPGTVVNVPLL
ncbi:MAG: DUF5615 family PIN-like protein [Nitrospirota bacterium]